MSIGTQALLFLALALLPSVCAVAQQPASAISNMSPSQVVAVMQSQTTNGVTTFAEFLNSFGRWEKPRHCNPVKTNDTYNLVFSVHAQTRGGGVSAYFIHDRSVERTNAVLWSIQSWTNKPDGEIRIDVKK